MFAFIQIPRKLIDLLCRYIHIVYILSIDALVSGGLCRECVCAAHGNVSNVVAIIISATLLI